jgi:hypothetical protein
LIKQEENKVDSAQYDLVMAFLSIIRHHETQKIQYWKPPVIHGLQQRFRKIEKNNSNRRYYMQSTDYVYIWNLKT